MNEIRAAIGELIDHCVWRPCANCGDYPHGSVQVNLHTPLVAGDFDGLLALCDDCFNDYLAQTRMDQAEREASETSGGTAE